MHATLIFAPNQFLNLQDKSLQEQIQTKLFELNGKRIFATSRTVI